LKNSFISNKNYFVIKYEDLRGDINTYNKLCNDLNLEILDNIKKEYKKPSSKTHPKSNVRGELDGREFLNNEELNIIYDILIKFKQNLYDFKS
jgi:hypothetical protein